MLKILDFTKFSQAKNKKEKDSFVQEMGEALQEIGFIAFKNHPLKQELVQETYKVAEEFFFLPLEEKLKCVPLDTSRLGVDGYTPFGKEKAKDAKVPDLKEFYHIHSEGNNIWPQSLPQFRKTFELLTKIELNIAHQICDAASLYLKLDEKFFSQMIDGGNSVLRVIHYPPMNEGYIPGAVRAAAHEDINFLTILPNATTSGLQVQTHKGEWFDAPTDPSLIIVDTGDMIQNLTNGVFKSTTHRVVNSENGNQRRYSLPFFIHPRDEVSLKPMTLEGFKKIENKNFRDLTAGQYLKERLDELFRKK